MTPAGFFSKNLEGKNFSHILLWMPNWIGDVIMVLPSIQTLRARFPCARITAVVKSPADQILRNHPAIDTVIRSPYQKGKKGMTFAWKLKKYQFDLGVVFPNSFRSAFLLYLSGAAVRIGYGTEGREVFLTHALKVSKEKKVQYRVNYFSDLFSPLGLEQPDKRFVQYVSEELRENINLRLKEIYPGSLQLLVAVHPGTSKPERGWHPKRFGLLCQRMIKDFGAKIALLGSEKERPLLKEIQQNCPSDDLQIFCGWGLEELTALIGRCDLFIGNDSGLMHLAAMVETPTVGIFGPGDPRTTGPYLDDDQKVLVTKNYSCSPCRQKFFRECKPSVLGKPFCLEDISIKDVAEGAETLLANRGFFKR